MSLPFEYTFLGGSLLGVASTLHCAGMCGPIASTMLFGLGRDLSFVQRGQSILVAQLGKAASYAFAGFVLGLVGASFASVFDRDLAFSAAQWVAAACLSWIGLSVAGLVPSLARLDLYMGPLGRRLLAVQEHLRTNRYENSLLAGMLWGLIPCGMVYSALLSSLFTADPISGGIMMLGFALGTVPAVTASSLGVTGLRNLRAWRSARVVVGLAIAFFGVVGAVLSAPGGILCVSSPDEPTVTPGCHGLEGISARISE